MKEAQFQDKQVELLRKKGCVVTPLVGHSLMSGMPDLWVLNKFGAHFFIENKVWRNKGTQVEGQITDLLDGPQRITILSEMWPRNVFCPIVAFRDSEFIKNALCYVYDGVECYAGPWEEYILKITRIKPNDLLLRSIR